MVKGGVLIISLDFELCWGVIARKGIKKYKKNILGVRFAVPALLKLFNEYGIHATWATVGFLFFETKDDLIKGLPTKKPFYPNKKLLSYNEIDNIGPNEKKDPFHCAPSLIKLIVSSPNQEIATHTFSHYYCLEKGQNKETFKDDLEAAITVAKKYNLTLESIVFPQNQINEQYLSICREMGIRAYRGNESSWPYKVESLENESLAKRALRLMDAYLNISGHNAYSLNNISRALPLNIPSSRFLRPYSNCTNFLEPLRLHRILSDLTHAAKNDLIYHLWWHCYNFGDNMGKNIKFLKKILDHFLNLREKYGMKSFNMKELTNKLLNESNDYKK